MVSNKTSTEGASETAVAAESAREFPASEKEPSASLTDACSLPVDENSNDLLLPSPAALKAAASRRGFFKTQTQTPEAAEKPVSENAPLNSVADAAPAPASLEEGRFLGGGVFPSQTTASRGRVRVKIQVVSDADDAEGFSLSSASRGNSPAPPVRRSVYAECLCRWL